MPLTERRWAIWDGNWPTYSAICPECHLPVGFTSEQMAQRHVEDLQTAGWNVAAMRVAPADHDGVRACACWKPPVAPSSAVRAPLDLPGEPERQVRLHDPETSRQAAAVGLGRRGSIRREIAQWVAEGNFGKTRDEVSEALGRKPDQVWRRISELVRDGWLRYGDPRLGASGVEQQTIWPTEALGQELPADQTVE